MALLDGFTRIYHDLTRSLYVAVEDDIIRLVKEDSAIEDSDDEPKAYEEAQGWFGDFEEKFGGMDEKAIAAWMKDGYGGICDPVRLPVGQSSAGRKEVGIFMLFGCQFFHNECKLAKIAVPEE